MAIPGFTAAASLSPPDERYSIARDVTGVVGTVVPQLGRARPGSRGGTPAPPVSRLAPRLRSSLARSRFPIRRGPRARLPTGRRALAR